MIGLILGLVIVLMGCILIYCVVADVGNKAIIVLTVVFILLLGVFFNAGWVVIESDVVISNESLRAISSDTYVNGHISGGLFVTAGYVNSDAVYKYYYLTDSGRYAQKSIPASLTEIEISNSTPCVITYMDTLQYVFFGFMYDPTSIYQTNKHYVIVIPENGLSTEMYLE